MKVITILILFLGLSRTMKAQCVKGNCIDGQGKYIYSNNSSYEGHFLKGNQHGKGSLIFKEGHYIGSFKKNKKDGEGRLSYNSGERYIGQFKSNTFYGKGKFVYANGDVYKGHWQDGKKEGLGTYIYVNQDIYVGYFVNDKKSGKGTLTKVDQNSQNGIWHNDILIDMADSNIYQRPSNSISEHFFENCNENYCHEINGRYTYSDGSVYEGMFINNQPQGEGNCKYSNGNQYSGGWRNHGPHGLGVMTFLSGKKYGAEWSYGNPIKQVTDNQLLKAHSEDKPKIKEFNEKIEIFACIIGIASYSHMTSLKYTDDDAYHLYAFLKSPEGGAIKDKNITTLIDDAATKNNIIYELKTITEKADANDVIIVYLSGHGIEGAYVPSDFDGFNNNLPYSDILQIIDASAAKHKVCIADACYSGSMYAAKNINYQGLESYYSQFNSLSGGTAFLTSSKSEEVSLEYSGLRHGVFSHFLIEGLKGKADSNANSVVTIHELFKYIHNGVRAYTNHKQTPTLSGDFNKDMPLSNVRSLYKSL